MAGHYSFDTTDLQDAALTAYVAALNAEREEPFADNQAFVTAQVSVVLAPAVERFLRAHINEIADRVRVASLSDILAAERVLPPVPVPEPEPEPEPDPEPIEFDEDGNRISRQ